MGGMKTNISTFRAIDRELVRRLELLNENSRFIDGLFTWMGAKTKVVPVKHNPRLQGKTKYNLVKLIRLWFDMVTSFSDFPLKLATLTGIGFGIFSALAALYYLLRKVLFGFDVPGFATLVIAILLFSGILLFCLGMRGQHGKKWQILACEIIIRVPIGPATSEMIGYTAMDPGAQMDLRFV